MVNSYTSLNNSNLFAQIVKPYLIEHDLTVPATDCTVYYSTCCFLISPSFHLHSLQLQVLTEHSVAFRARLSRMVLVMVQLFLLCWGPIQLYILVRAFSPHFQYNYCTYKLKIWAHCMSYLNSCVNPVVYAFMGAHFRKAFRRTFPCMFKQRVAAAPQPPNRNAHTEMQYVS